VIQTVVVLSFMHASFFPYFLVTILVLELGYGMMSNALNLSTRGLRPLLLLVTVLPFDPKYFLSLRTHVHSPSMTNDNNVCLHVWERWIDVFLSETRTAPDSSCVWGDGKISTAVRNESLVY